MLLPHNTPRGEYEKEFMVMGVNLRKKTTTEEEKDQ